jgi:hypothetical protein
MVPMAAPQLRLVALRAQLRRHVQRGLREHRCLCEQQAPPLMHDQLPQAPLQELQPPELQLLELQTPELQTPE